MLVKAKLSKLNPPNDTEDTDSKVEVQFNPQQLSISYNFVGAPASQRPSRRTSDGSVAAHTNQRTDYCIKLSSLDLFFDTTQNGEDVRNQTLKIAKLLLVEDRGQTTSSPIVRFQWGKLIFKGTIDSMTETIDYFSEEGVPLRATVRITMSMIGNREITPSSGSGQGLGVSASASAGVSAGISASAGVSASFNLSAGGAVGTSALTLAAAGASLQGIAGKAGVDWKVVASANNIDNPRQLGAGAVLNLNAKVNANASARLGGG